MLIRKGLLRQMKKRKIVTILALITLCGFCLFQTFDLFQDDIQYIINIYLMPRKYDNISCHYINANDALPSVESLTFRPPPKSIFFHETSCEGDLDSRQACSIESAARAHPDWHIYVLFSAPVSHSSLHGRTLKRLQTLSNVQFARVHIKDYAKGTPLEPLVSDGTLNRSLYAISHTSDVLRYLTLYRWGGVYLDLDVIVARPLGSLARNWAARESNYDVAAGTLAFSRDAVGRKIADAAIRDITSNFRGDVWGHNGPGVITRIVKELCSTTDIKYTNKGACNGFKIYGPEQFYPISWENASLFFDDVELEVNNPYVYHLWNHKTHDFSLTKECPFVKLAKKYCPTIYDAYGVSFGS